MHKKPITGTKGLLPLLVTRSACHLPPSPLHWLLQLRVWAVGRGAQSAGAWLLTGEPGTTWFFSATQLSETLMGKLWPLALDAIEGLLSGGTVRPLRRDSEPGNAGLWD